MRVNGFGVFGCELLGPAVTWLLSCLLEALVSLAVHYRVQNRYGSQKSFPTVPHNEATPATHCGCTGFDVSDLTSLNAGRCD